MLDQDLTGVSVLKMHLAVNKKVTVMQMTNARQDSNAALTTAKLSTMMHTGWLTVVLRRKLQVNE